jgi:predicted amidohydrolase
MEITVAIAQAASVVLDLAGSVAKACEWIGEAGRRGAQLIPFPETWLPVYPLWCDTGSLGKWEHEPSKRLHARLTKNSLQIPSPETENLCRVAREAHCAVVMGANERVNTGSLYNTLLFISAAGEILGRHRKLAPTGSERLIWGQGDAVGLRSFEIAGARVGGLICWEHWMPLARQVLHADGEQIHVAAWPAGTEIYQIASRQYAFEGRAFVLLAASYLTKSMLPRDFELAEDFAGADEVLLDGGSAVIAPNASYVVEPVRGREELIVTEVGLDRIAEEKLSLDVAGHYSRPDLFELRVNREPRKQFLES